jgi:sugar/nucleoside kinase (ribokinase family)
MHNGLSAPCRCAWPRWAGLISIAFVCLQVKIFLTSDSVNRGIFSNLAPLWITMRTANAPMKTLDISIAGEINLDLIMYGLPEVMPVERELLGTDFQLTLGSSSAIFAHNLAVLGLQVGFISLLGRDALGKVALERLGASGVDLSRVRVSEDSTATGVTLILPHGRERHILTYPGTMAELRRRDLDIEYLKSAKHFHLASLFLQRSLEPDLPALFKELKAAGLTISLDTNDDPSGQWGGVLEELLEYVDVLLPNEMEACRMAKKATVDEAIEELGRRVPCVAVKCGSRGAIVRVDGKTFSAPAVSVTPVDTIGAGDSFNAGFLFGWLKGWLPDQCAYAGNITGALSTQGVGGTEAFRDPGLVQRFLAQHSFPERERIESFTSNTGE